MSEDYTADVAETVDGTVFVHFARLAMEGKREDVVTYLRRQAYRGRTRSPQTARALQALLGGLPVPAVLRDDGSSVYGDDAVSAAKSLVVDALQALIIERDRVMSAVPGDDRIELSVWQRLDAVLGGAFGAQADHVCETCRTAPLSTIAKPVRVLMFGVLDGFDIASPQQFAAMLRAVSEVLGALARGEQVAVEQFRVATSVLRGAFDALDHRPSLLGESRPRRPVPAGIAAVVAESTAAIGLDHLQALSRDAAAHVDRLGIVRDDWVRLAKIAEEAGEVLGALSKRDQGRGGNEEVLAELGDVFLAALVAAQQLGVAPAQIIAQRWAQVSPRSQQGLPVGR